MKLEEHVPLKTLTTLKVGGNARYVATCASEEEIQEVIAFAKERSLPFLVLGGGSNVLPDDEGYDGVVIMLSFKEISFSEDGEQTLVIAGASVGWDDLVSLVVERGLWGIENLAGIPGTVGGAPVQNIGAYGAELKDVLSYIEVFDASTGTLRTLTSEECAFGYRESLFKQNPSLIILRVALSLTRNGTPNLSYKDLRSYSESPLTTPSEIAEAVRAIRSRKFPDLSVCGTAGSFFKNPVVSEEAYKALTERYKDLPGFPTNGGIKISLAWLLDNVLSLRGFCINQVRLFEAQPLVLVAEEGATAKDISLLAEEVATRVFDATGITLEREVRTLPKK